MHSNDQIHVVPKRRSRRRAAAPHVSAQSPREPTRVASDSPLVLLVDDVEDNRDLYATYFAYAGYRVDQARDGEEALTKVGREKPAVIVMDLAMPVLDGWEATRLLKSNPRTKDIVVLVLTGHATRDDIARARAAGADDVCTKPCYPHDLLNRVQALLGRPDAR